jgi:HlyD family secretion protein
MSGEIIPAGATPAIVLQGGFQPDRALKQNLRRGMMLTGILVLGLGGLAAFLPMSGAVIAVGSVSVAHYVKEIGHPFGGVIAAVFVRDGDHVTAGQPLIKIDDSVTGASAKYTGENVDQLEARAARLVAERDGLPGIIFPPSLLQRASDPSIAALMDQESRAFILRRQSRLSLIGQLRERIAQAQQEANGSRAQAQSYTEQGKLINQELESTRELYRNHYTTLDRLNALERSAASLNGNVATSNASANSALARIGELQVQMASVAGDARSMAAAELLDTQSRISELRRLKATADDGFERSMIRAPNAGTIDKVAFRTVGGVIPPNQKLMEIVPDDDQLVVELRIPINEIDQVSVGQTVNLRFSAFSSRTTPEIEGRISRVAANRTVEPELNFAYYTSTVSITRKELARLGDQPLKPGMPVEAFIQTNSRTMLSYLIKPLFDQIRRAFREN